MKIKKVLLISSLYKPNIGGVEITIGQMAQHLRADGIETVVLTKRFPKVLSEFEVIDGVPVHRIDRPQSDEQFHNIITEILSNEPALRADIVHIIGIRRPMPLLGLLLAKRWKVPYVVTFAGGDLPQNEDQESVKIWSEGVDTVPSSVNQADCWTAFSTSTAKLASELLGDNMKPLIVYGGIDLKSISEAKPMSIGNPYFFIARRIEKSKGIDILIKAFSLICNQLPDVSLIIAGEGSEREELERLSNELGLGNKVRFLGFIDPTTVFSYMKGSIAHICPSRSESGGLVNYESQASGCLTIGSDADGIPEYISDGKTGILFKSGDIDGLAQKLLLAARNDQHIRDIKKAAIESSRDHGWETFTKNYIGIYRDLIMKNLSRRFKPWSKLTERLARQMDI